MIAPHQFGQVRKSSTISFPICEMVFPNAVSLFFQVNLQFISKKGLPTLDLRPVKNFHPQTPYPIWSCLLHAFLTKGGGGQPPLGFAKGGGLKFSRGGGGKTN